MNERIKELVMSIPRIKDMYDVGPVQRASIEEFAEMIIAECARIGELKEQGYKDYDPEMSVGWYMKQHFGVEE